MADAGEYFGCVYCQGAYPDKRELEVHCKMIHPGQEFKFVMRTPAESERKSRQAPTAAISKRMPLSEVNRHCVPEDCWVAIDGKVYDLTEFMDRHPGGPTTVLKQAGKDATKIFYDIHKGVRIEQYLRPEAFLGDLGIDEDLMSDDFWHTLRKARIEEIDGELERLNASDVSRPSTPGSQKASSIIDLLQATATNEDLKNRLRQLETQKRVALDAEDFVKAAEVKAKQTELLAVARVELGLKPEAASGGIPLSEVARHNKPHDLWVAVNGVVYDLTDFLLHHPEQRNVLLAWAGRDATPVWDKIPGRFPSKTWMNMFMRPELRMGEVAPEPALDKHAQLIKNLKNERRRLMGPSDEEIQAAKAGSKKPQAAAEAAAGGEEERFPKLKDVKVSKDLPFFTRAEVAKHKGPVGGAPGTEPYMILHNKVYDLRPLLGAHPGGDDLLLNSAGLDATKEFEIFEHSEKARVRREQEMLVGYIVPAEASEWGKEAAAAGGVAAGGVESGPSSDLAQYLRYKVADVAVGVVALYAYKSYKHRKPLSNLTYSRLLRHLHLIMAVGIFGTLASAKAASYSDGLTKKRFLAVHKQTGVAMFAALLVRMYARMTSGIPPRFPSNPVMKFIETQSLRLFYLLIFVLPVSGMANEYFLKWASGDDAENDKKAKQSIEVHKSVGKFFEYVWMPFHLGWTTLYHASRGRGVVRKVSPFI